MPLDVAATVGVVPGAGFMGSDRVGLVLPDGAVVNSWLEISMLPTPRTGLLMPVSVYFGNLVGETASVSEGCVDQWDVELTQLNLSSGVPIYSSYDYNRDGNVDEFDVAIVRAHADGHSLAADLNADGRVGLADLVILQRRFGSAATPTEGDLDGSGVVTARDVALFALDFGRTGATTNCLELITVSATSPRASSASPLAPAAVVAVSRVVAAPNVVAGLPTEPRAAKLRVERASRVDVTVTDQRRSHDRSDQRILAISTPRHRGRRPTPQQVDSAFRDALVGTNRRRS